MTHHGKHPCRIFGIRELTREALAIEMVRLIEILSSQVSEGDGRKEGYDIHDEPKELYLPCLLRHEWSTPGQLPDHALPGDEGTLHRQRPQPTIRPRPLHGHRLPLVRDQCYRRVSARRQLVPVRALPPRHHVRPEGAATRQCATLHRAVRAAHQPVQREDLPVPLVLDGLCGDHVLCQSPHVDCSLTLLLGPSALREEAHRADAGGQGRRHERHPHQGQRGQILHVVHGRLSAKGRRLRAAAGRPQHQRHHRHGVRVGPVEEIPSGSARQQRHERGQLYVRRCVESCQLHVRRWLRVSST